MTRAPAPSLPRGLYGMADASLGDPVWQAERLIHGGCAAIQLRCKGWTTADRTRAARAIRALTRPAAVVLIINDDIACAAATGADGVHLGQGDGPIGVARATLPPGALVGRSTHGPRELAAARAEGADYVGFGPVFSTTTKDTGFSAQGTARLRAAVGAFGGPVVAIGGITVARLAEVRRAGAHAWAVGGGIWRTADPDDTIRALCGRPAPPAESPSR